MEISKTTIIDAPASLVFIMLLDANFATAWLPHLTHYEVISKTNNMVGSTYRSRFDFNGFKYEQISEIKGYVKNLSLEWVSNCKFCNGSCNYFLTAISDTQTAFKQISHCQYKGWMKIWIWLTKSKSRKASEDYTEEAHENFKRLVEAEYKSGNT